MGREPNLKKLPAATIEGILAATRGGAFPHVAAMAYGVPKSTWWLWLGKGKAARSGEPLDRCYVELLDRVEAASAMARLTVEMSVKANKPELWLTRGPGRDRGDAQDPGRTDGRQELELVNRDGSPLIPIEAIRALQRAAGELGPG